MMDTDDELMSAEEFFGFEDEDSSRAKKSTCASRRKGKGKEKDVFAEVKVKLAMRIYGVSRAKALEIIAERAKKSEGGDESEDRTTGRPGKRRGLMSAVDFFGEV